MEDRLVSWFYDPMGTDGYGAMGLATLSNMLIVFGSDEVGYVNEVCLSSIKDVTGFFNGLFPVENIPCVLISFNPLICSSEKYPLHNYELENCIHFGVE